MTAPVLAIDSSAPPRLGNLSCLVLTSSFVDGKPQASISLSDRGLSYGHGVFETMRLSAGELPLWGYHRQRLGKGADKLGIVLDLPLLETYLRQALDAFPAEGMVKLLLTAGAGPRGYRCHNQRASYVVQYFESSSIDAAKLPTVRLQLCDYVLPHNRQLAGVKHLNRLDQVIAAAQLDDGFDGLLLDVDGNVIEALSSNLFLHDGEGWLTPNLDLCGVTGVMRTFLCEKIMPGIGLRPETKQIDIENLTNASEVFVCNALNGVRPVTELKGLAYWPVGPESQRINDELKRVYPCFGD